MKASSAEEEKIMVKAAMIHHMNVAIDDIEGARDSQGCGAAEPG